MGILYSNAELMIKAKKNGVSFNKVLTIGHLKLFLSKNEIRHLCEKYDLQIDVSLLGQDTYSNKFFKIILGSKDVQSLDYSNYENCNILHNMNESIDSRYFETFDVVVDGGTLEHVFNFPIAISNCMQMLKQGGSFFTFTMANNHMGHGFYQFSPELFFRIFHDDNGFNVESLLLEEHKYPGAELIQKAKLYEVKDPHNIRGRVGLVSKSPVMMLVHAIRKEIKPIFKSYPIQSDYTSTYAFHDGVSHVMASPSTLKDMIKKFFFRLPLFVQHFLEGKRQLIKYSFNNTSFYKKISR